MTETKTNTTRNTQDMTNKNDLSHQLMNDPHSY